MKLRCVFACLLVIIIFAGCSRSSASGNLTVPAESGIAGRAAAKVPAWPAIAILKTGAYPIWFEFSGGPAESGVRQINSPAEATLADFTPWPLAYYSAGMLVSKDESGSAFLTMAVNRYGFIIAIPDAVPGADQTVELYSAANPSGWDSYSVASFFLYNEKPSVLLHRDNFFSTTEGPPPEYPVQAIDASNPVPVGISLPALDILLSENQWEAEAINPGPDNAWYYRVIQSGKSRPETAYYRTADLSQPGVKINQGEYRNSSAPQKPDNDLSALNFLAAGIRDKLQDSQGTAVLRIVTPDFAGARDFELSALTDSGMNLLYGYCSTDSQNDGLAFAVLPDGQGFAYSGKTFFDFALPALPQGFSYTGAALAGDTLIATWEEQQGYSIGAAGFMALSAESLGL